MKYFWINLDSAESRRNTLLKAFTENNITDHYRVNAYLSPEKTKSGYENACSRSHIQAITHFLLDTNDEYALICEDDLTFELKKYWKTSIEDLVANAPSDWGIIQLGVILQRIEQKFRSKELYFKYMEQPVSSTLAYVIRRPAAIKLINTYLDNNNIYNTSTIDCFRNGIYSRVDKYTSYTAYIYKYPPFIYSDENDSIIGNSIDLHKSSKQQLIKYLSQPTAIEM